MNNKVETASRKFISGYNCAQAVLFSFAEDFKIDKNVALKIACGFGAGMAPSYHDQVVGHERWVTW